MRSRLPPADAAASRSAARVAGMSPTSARSGWRVAVSSRLGDVERDDLRLLAEAAAEGEAEVERDADHERDVGLLEALAARAAEAELVVGGQTAAAHAVQEDRDPERLGERRISSSPRAQ